MGALCVGYVELSVVCRYVDCAHVGAMQVCRWLMYVRNLLSYSSAYIMKYLFPARRLLLYINIYIYTTLLPLAQ